jgi:hypothetical protein
MNEYDKQKVFRFDELTEEGKEKAIENLYDVNVDHDWWDFAYENAKAIAALMGIEIDKIYFSGFSSQGDGACFEGSYSYQKGGVKAVKDYAPLDKELHRIAKELQAIQRTRFYTITASVKHSGHYFHEFCTNVSIYESNPSWDSDYSTDAKTADDLTEALRDFMSWIYSQLEKQHDYLTSKEAIIETIEANEYEFTAEGKLY